MKVFSDGLESDDAKTDTSCKGLTGKQESKTRRSQPDRVVTGGADRVSATCRRHQQEKSQSLLQ